MRGCFFLLFFFVVHSSLAFRPESLIRSKPLWELFRSISVLVGATRRSFIDFSCSFPNKVDIFPSIIFDFSFFFFIIIEFDEK